MRVSPLLVVIAAAAACAVSPVAWDEPAAVETVGPATQLVIGPDGTPSLTDASAMPTAWEPEAACPGSVRFAHAPGAGLHAVWWEPRERGSAALLASRSADDGHSWEPIVPVDTLDRARLGCDRPAPAITVDSLTGYIHIAYFLHGPQGPGIFFSHSMEGGTFYHAPVPIVYGERPSAAAIASHGSTVVIAFQDPNTSAPRVSLALSSTDGHLFELRLPRISASSSAAERPRVSVRGDRVAIAWIARPVHGAGEGVTMVRAGTVRSRRGPGPDGE